MKEIVSFKDIPQFTRSGNYEVSYGLAYVPELIKRWEEDDWYNLQMNPPFQRGHVWTEQQQIAFVEYLLRGGTAHTTVYFNCPFWQGERCGNYLDFVCVDGLQRITAVCNFINNKIKVFGKYYKDFEGRINEVRYNLKFNVNDLKTEEEVLIWYLEMNSGGTPHTEEELNRVRAMLLEKQSS